ncbi:MAG: DotI/IcmL family type IV secretion protein [Legionellales bacterium]|nr:DotI/IcmL family type IV secretion protein [Legionellales bacterium]
MRYHRLMLGWVLLFLWTLQVKAFADEAQLSVWANEAIIETYTYSYQNLLEQQKHIATYFSVPGWMSFINAIRDAKLLDAVKKNNYFVNAVALMPPTIRNTSPTSWQAVMPVLIVYKNAQYEQKQYVSVTLDFSQAPVGKGVRGFFINSLRTKEIAPPCVCKS